MLDKRLDIRCSGPELAAWVRAAGGTRLLSAWVRATLNGDAGTVPSRPSALSQDERVVDMGDAEDVDLSEPFRDFDFDKPSGTVAFTDTTLEEE